MLYIGPFRILGPTRHCMEFMLLFMNKMKKINSPYLVSVVHLVYFVVFFFFFLGGGGGGVQVFVAAFCRRRKLQQTLENHPKCKTTKNA